MELKNLADAINSGDLKKIHEASIKRLEKHIQQDASKSFAILTGFRGSNTKKQNLSNNKKLGLAIRSLRLGYFKLDGHWGECSDETIEYNDCPEEKKSQVREPSYFVPNLSKDQAVKLAKKFQQDAIVYQGPETDNKIELISKSGATIEKLGKFTPNKVAQAFSKIKGKSFVFEGLEYIPSGVLTNMAFSAYKNNTK